MAEPKKADKNTAPGPTPEQLAAMHHGGSYRFENGKMVQTEKPTQPAIPGSRKTKSEKKEAKA